MSTLYQIESQYQDLFARLEKAATRDLSPEEQAKIIESLEINEAELKQKAEAYAAVIRQKQARDKFLAEEIKRLQQMRNSERRQAEVLTERINQALTSRGLEKLETDHFRLGFRSSEAVVFDVPEDQLPAEYLTYKPQANKTAIKAALKAGEIIPGAKLAQNKNLQIR